MPSQPDTGTPYLSVVIAARNDDHGGNLLGRMQAMVDSWLTQAERYDLASEIVVVEWNPPPDRPSLRDSLQWPSRPGATSVRFVGVPPEIHARFRNSTAIRLHQMIAKNVGIRRARGEFVLATNLDIIFSAELMRFFAERRLERRVMYRVDRHDVANALPANASMTDVLAFCESHTLRVFAREGEFQLSGDGLRTLDSQDIVSQEAGIRFGAGWSAAETSEGDRYRWAEPEAELFFERPSAAAPRLMLAAEVGPGAASMPVSMEILDQSGSVLAATVVTGRCDLHLHMPDDISTGRLLLRVRGLGLPLARNPRILNLRVFGLEWEPAAQPGSAPGPHGRWLLETLSTGPAVDWGSTYYAPSPFASEIRNAAYLHTNAAGDFTLLSRDDWFSLRAYPELPIWPMHIDCLLCYAAHHAGIRESILRESMRIYHVQHSAGAGWTPEGEHQRLARLAAKGVSEMSYQEVAKWIDLMRRYNAPAIFTAENWGLGDAPLSERNVWQ